MKYNLGDINSYNNIYDNNSCKTYVPHEIVAEMYCNNNINANIN